MNEFYRTVKEKGESMYHFIKFIDYMVDNNKYVNSEEFKDFRDDYIYHFERIPNYTRETMGQLRYDLIGDVANIGAAATTLSKRIDKLTKLSK